MTSRAHNQQGHRQGNRRQGRCYERPTCDRSLDELASLSERDVLPLVDAPVGTGRHPCALLLLKVLQSGLRAYADRA